jgi:hypothetical protein
MGSRFNYWDNFADNGLIVITSTFFPKAAIDHLVTKAENKSVIKNAEVIPLKSIR